MTCRRLMGGEGGCAWPLLCILATVVQFTLNRQIILHIKANCFRKTKIWKFWKEKRYLVAFLTFLGLANLYILRVNLSVAVVAMNSPYNVTLKNGTVLEVQDFYWNSKDRGYVLSSFFYGYICTNLIGGWMAARWGGSRLFALGVGVTALFTILTPPIAYTSFYLLLVTRVIEGFFEGVTFPCFLAMFAKWAPPQESSIMISAAYTGVPVGTVLGMQASGLIGSILGWPFIFYIPGAIGLLWCGIWLALVRDSPEDDPHISPEELKYIKESLGKVETITRKRPNVQESQINIQGVTRGLGTDGILWRKRVTHPWKSIFTSVPFWAIVVVTFSACWGHYTLLTQLPTFLKDALDFQLAKSGLMSSLPYIMMGVATHICGGFSYWLLKRNCLTTGQVRKLFICGPLLLQAITLCIVGHFKSPLGIIICLVFDVAMEGFLIPSYCLNTLDISPDDASVLMGIANTIGTLAGIISPIVSGFIVTDKSVDQWKIVFYIYSGFCVFGALFFGVFSSGEKQPWATDKPSTMDKQDKQHE